MSEARMMNLNDGSVSADHVENDDCGELGCTPVGPTLDQACERPFSSLVGSATSVALSWWQEDITVSIGMQATSLETATEIIQRCRELDDENIGEHKDKYTLHEAIVNVLHFDPTYLFDRLGGWWETA